jgi:hypothetical protein
MKGIEKTNDKDAKVLLQPLDIHLCAVEYFDDFLIGEGLVQEMQMASNL